MMTKRNCLITVFTILVTGPITLFAQHFQVAAETEWWCGIIVEADADGYLFREGDEIGFFDPDGVCAGMGIFEGNDDIGVFLYGDDPDTDFDEGFEDGDVITFRVWLAICGDEHDEFELAEPEEPIQWRLEWIIEITLRCFFPFGLIFEDAVHDFGVIDMVINEPQIWETTLGVWGHNAFPMNLIYPLGDTAFYDFSFDVETIYPDSTPCTITVTFPTGDYEMGMDYSAFLHFSHFRDEELIDTVYLFGSVGAPLYELSRNEFDFGDVAVDSNDAEIPIVARDTVMLINIGTATLLYQLGIPPPFYLEPDVPDSGSIPPDSVFAVPIFFDPDSIGEHRAEMSIATNSLNNPQNPIVILNGRGVNPNGVYPYKGSSPSSFVLSVHPNPFNSTTTISFNIPTSSTISLEVYNPLGQRVQTLFEGRQQAGTHTANLIATDLPSGLYFVRLEASDQIATQRIMLIK